MAAAAAAAAEPSAVWLVSRSLDERISSTEAGRRLRRQLWPSAGQLGLKSLAASMKTLATQTRHAVNFAKDRVVGIALVRPLFSYDHMKLLNSEQRSQYNLWRSVAPDRRMVGSLYFYEIVHAIDFPPVSDDMIFGDKRHQNKFWHQVLPEHAGLLFRTLSVPGWCAHEPLKAVCLPYDMAAKCACGSSKSFAILDNFPLHGYFNWPAAVGGFPRPSRWAAPDEGLQGNYDVLADDLRCLSISLMRIGDPDNDELDLISHWIGVIQNTADTFLKAVDINSDKSKHIREILLADCLRNDSDMREVLEVSARISLPRDQAMDVIQQLNEKQCQVDKGTLSRSRFLLDCAYMLLWRRWNREAMGQDGNGCVWYPMTDSSPQFHRNYQVTLLRRIERRHLADLVAAADELFGFWDERHSGIKMR